MCEVPTRYYYTDDDQGHDSVVTWESSRVCVGREL